MKKILLLLILIPLFTLSGKSQPSIDSSYVYSIPNAFTPNGDGINDTFGPVVYNATCCSFRVIDRNNNVLYQSLDSKGWDGTCNGKKSNQEVYVWEIILVDLWGKKHIFLGHFTLI